MNRVLLSSNVLHDTTMEYLAAWSDKVAVKAAFHKDIEFLELKREAVNRKEFEKILQEKQPRLVIVHSHGKDDGIADFSYGVLVKCDENAEIFKNRIVHALSCQSGRTLAPKCIELGTTAYVGYVEDYKFLGSDSHLNDKGNDPVAAFFLDPAFEVVMALIEGDSVEMAFNKSQAMMKMKLSDLIMKQTPMADSLRDSLSPLLFHNLKHQKAFGDLSAVF